MISKMFACAFVSLIGSPFSSWNNVETSPRVLSSFVIEIFYLFLQSFNGCFIHDFQFLFRLSMRAIQHPFKHFSAIFFKHGLSDYANDHGLFFVRYGSSQTPLVQRQKKFVCLDDAGAGHAFISGFLEFFQNACKSFRRATIRITNFSLLDSVDRATMRLGDKFAHKSPYFSLFSVPFPISVDTSFLPYMATNFHTAHGLFWVFGLLDALVTNSRQPLLKWLGLGRRNGLDNAEQPFDVRAFGCVLFAVCGNEFQFSTVGFPYDYGVLQVVHLVFGTFRSVLKRDLAFFAFEFSLQNLFSPFKRPKEARLSNSAVFSIDL